MSLSWQTVAETWRWRGNWFWPLVLTPLVVVAWTMSRPAESMASLTLQMDASNFNTPLLQDWSKPANRKVLERTLHRPEMLADTAAATGVQIDPQKVWLDVLGPDMLRINYRSGDNKNLDEVVSTLGANFIYELLAPERLRLDQQMAQVSRDLRQIEAQLLAPDVLEGSGQRKQFETQRDLLQQQYKQILSDLTSISQAFDSNTPHALLWPAEPALVRKPAPLSARISGAIMMGLALGTLLAWFNVRIQQRRRAQTALPESLASLTGENLAGQLPDLGRLDLLPISSNEDGKDVTNWALRVSSGDMMLDPVEFTEVMRLHRALTRNLRGALVMTSSREGEGKTLMSALMAMRSQRQGKKTLLIDLNLKDYALTRMFEGSPTAWKLGASGKKAAQAWAGELMPLGENIDLLPVPNDADTLKFLQNGAKVQAWMEELAETYEHIIVDTTPVLALNRQNADPLSLRAARIALITESGVTPMDMLQHTLTQLHQQGIASVSIVANDRNNPSDKALLLSFFRTLDKWMPGLGQWLRAKALKSANF